MGNFWLKEENKVNPIVDFDKDFVVYYGRKTLARKPILMDRIGARRMLLFIKERLKAQLGMILFDPVGEAKENLECFSKVLMEYIADLKGIKDDWQVRVIEKEKGFNVELEFTLFRADDSCRIVGNVSYERSS